MYKLMRKGRTIMNACERRERILKELKESNKPIKGHELSKKYNVSRQIIVQDIALLRARGEEILATPQGYIIPNSHRKNKLIEKIVCKHWGYDEMEDELRTIVDLGGRIIDVIVDHPLYGEIKSPLQICSRLDLQEFMTNIRETNAEPLSSLTEGIHIHTIEVNDRGSFERIKKALMSKNYLIKED